MKVSLFIVMIFSSALCFAEVPSWLKHPEKEFPTSEYIRSIGEGSSEKIAKNSAIADISLYFDAKTDVLTSAVKNSSAVLSGDKAVFTTSQSYSQIANISSSAEFFCLNFTDSYFDKKQKKYFALAYINKNEAAGIYKSRISALKESIDTYRKIANVSKETFYAVQALEKAKVLSELAEQYIKIETMIIPSDTKVFQETLNSFSRIAGEIEAKKSAMTFSIIMNQSDKKFESIFSTVSSILAKRGYAYSVSNSSYKIIIDITCSEEQYDAGPFVRASSNILILNNSGEGVYTYSKAYSRTGSDSYEKAYIRVVSKIKTDLEENFLPEF